VPRLARFPKPQSAQCSRNWHTKRKDPEPELHFACVAPLGDAMEPLDQSIHPLRATSTLGRGSPGIAEELVERGGPVFLC
jgi:hypothetical protein